MAQADEKIRLLLIDDDEATLANLSDILSLDGYEVVTSTSLQRAQTELSAAAFVEFAIILVDRRLPDGVAEQFLPLLKSLAPKASLVIMTAYPDLESTIIALREGVDDYFVKPLQVETLRNNLQRLLQRKRLQAAKERGDAIFRTLVEAAECVIIFLNQQSQVLYFSPFAEKLTGLHAAEVAQRDFVKTLLPADQRDACQAHLAQVQRDQVLRGVQYPIRAKDGDWRWLAWSFRMVDGDHGAIIAVGQDITELREAQAQALQSERLVAIGQMVAGLAHESRNALQRTQACLEMLALEIRGQERAVDLVGRIQQAQDHLQHIYEEVRHYSTLVNLERDQVDLREVIDEVWNTLSVAWDRRIVTLEVEIPAEIAVCHVDRLRLAQVFRNIFENSLAAAPEPIHLVVFGQAIQLVDQPAVELRFRDNGPGLSPDVRKRLFEPFFTTKTRGTGLGMAIARRFVEAHKGEIIARNWYQSTTAIETEITPTRPDTSLVMIKNTQQLSDSSETNSFKFSNSKQPNPPKALAGSETGDGGANRRRSSPTNSGEPARPAGTEIVVRLPRGTT